MDIRFGGVEMIDELLRKHAKVQMSSLIDSSKLDDDCEVVYVTNHVDVHNSHTAARLCSDFCHIYLSGTVLGTPPHEPSSAPQGQRDSCSGSITLCVV